MISTSRPLKWPRRIGKYMSAPPQKAEVEFSLFAPNNTEAALISDFNDWSESPMKKGGDGYFRISIDLADGIYQYKFKIRSKSWFYEPDEWRSITDPYATNVDATTQNAIVQISGGQKIVDEYVWRSDDVPLPENEKLVIYELHIGDFSGGEEDGFTRGKFRDVIAKLDHLADLGINAIELMPLKSNPGDFNWGYSPVHYFAPEESYGTTAELKELVDKCHSLGIRVIVDGVYNHSSTETPVAQIDHDYWFRHEGKDPEQNWGPEFNYEFVDERFGFCPALRYLLDSVRFWIMEYHIDGVRFDAAREIDNFDALDAFVENARVMSSMKPFFTVAEYIPPSPEIVEPDGPVESCWNDSFMYAIIECLSGNDPDLEKIKNAVDPRRLGFKRPTSVTNYLANHDQNRLFRKLGDHGILDDELYLRAKLGVLILMTAVGVPMVWMGEEFGEYVPLSENSNKINWTLLENERNKDFFNYYRSLIHLRTDHPAFHGGGIDFFHDDADNGVLGFQRFNVSGDKAVMMLNLSDNDLENYHVPDCPLELPCREYTSDTQVDPTGGKLVIDLPRRTGLIFV